MRKYIVYFLVILLTSTIGITTGSSSPLAPNDAPTGEERGILGGMYTYSISRIDDELQDTEYGWDWNGDNTVDEWIIPQQGSPELQTSHTWTDIGTFDIQVKLKDSTGESPVFSPSFSVFIFPLGDVNNDMEVTTPQDQTAFTVAQTGQDDFEAAYPNGNYWAADCNQDGIVSMSDINPFSNILSLATNNQPTTLSITGPSLSTPGVSTAFSFSSTATEDEQLFYQINWGDEITDWLGPYTSQEVITLSHQWVQENIYAIKVRAKDQYNEHSAWSEPTSVNIQEQTQPQLIGEVSENPVHEQTEITLTVTAEGTPLTDVNLYLPWDPKFTIHDQGYFTFFTPDVEQDTTYDIVIQKEGYQSTTLVLVVKNKVPTLTIDTPLSVFEEEQFTVTIQSDHEAVEDAVVYCGQLITTTDHEGKASFIAPNVATTSQYTVKAQKPGYTDATTLITIVNQQEKLGYLYGRISDEQGTPLPTAQVCFQPLAGGIKVCTLTDDQGLYTQGLTPGHYEISVHKLGHMSTTQIPVTVEQNVAFDHNFILNTSTISTETRSNEESFIDYSLQYENIGATLSLDQDDPIITYHLDDVSLSNVTVDTSISFSVSAPSETPATILVVRIPDTLIKVEEEISITYDTAALAAFGDVESFFNLEDNTNPGYLELKTPSGKRYVFIRVMQFSEHNIMITPQYLLSQLQSIGVFLGILILSLLLFIAPVYYFYYRKPTQE